MNVSELIGEWYDKNKRNLPWREAPIAYQIWISEIILQQTRVNQGAPYYFRFIERFPDVKALAAAPVEEVLLYWQGLGYYTRARNLHRAARIIMKDFNGIFPDDYDRIRALPGVGDYTAAAIASLAFNRPYAAVDGNVFRVLSRLHGIFEPINSGAGKKLFYEAAQNMLDKKDPGRHNQSMIELGALVCLPKNPKCDECPVKNACFARQKSSIPDLPVKNKKIKIAHRYFTYLVIQQEDSVYLRQRGEKDIWALLFDFPLIETSAEVTPDQVLLTIAKENVFNETAPVIKTYSREYRHLLSHQVLHVRFLHLLVSGPIRFQDAKPVLSVNLKHYPVPGLIRNFLKDEKLFMKSMDT